MLNEKNSQRYMFLIRWCMTLTFVRRK